MIRALPDRRLVRHRSLAGGITVGEYAFKGGGTLPSHHHEHARVCLVISGQMREQRGRRELARTPGSSTYLAPGDPHQEEFASAGVSVLAIDLPREWLAAHAVDLALVPRGFHELRAIAPIAWRIRDQLHCLDEFSALEIEGLALQLSAGLLRAASRRELRAPGWLRAVRDALDDRVACHWTVEALSGLAGVSPARLACEFRRHFGRSIAAHLRERRIEAALHLLRSTDVPLVRVAAMAGFSDQSHMTRWVRRHAGVTPHAFRVRYGGHSATT